MKIVILGYPGSGKTYLSDSLSKRLTIPVMHIDSVKYDKEWKPIGDSIAIERADAFMKQDDWIIEGNGSNLFYEKRLETADLILLLLLPRWRCLSSVFNRAKQRKKDGYSNDTNLKFINFVLWGSRSKSREEKYIKIMRQYGNKTVVLRSRKEINKLLKTYDFDSQFKNEKNVAD